MSNNKFKILIVEDEANILSFIKANLEISDYQVICAETCALGMMMYASYHPDLIVLDLGLPDRDGLSLIQDVREADTVPIIVLSARSGEMDKVEALDLGANDYITKPFGTEELMAVALGLMSDDAKALCDMLIAKIKDEARGWRNYFLRGEGVVGKSNGPSAESL